MKLPRRKFLYLAASAVPLSSISRIARAQIYPARPVRVIIPYAPGGPTDVFGRLMAQKLSEQLGKQFYVENVGGGGNVGIGQGARAAPDGYTVVCRDRPSQNPQGNHHASPSGGRQAHRAAGYEGAVGNAGLRAGRQYARRVCCPIQDRNCEMDEGNSTGGHQGAMRLTAC